MKAYYYPYDYSGRLRIKIPSNSLTHFQIVFYTCSIGIHKSGKQTGTIAELVYWNNRIAKFKSKEFKLILEINKR